MGRSFNCAIVALTLAVLPVGAAAQSENSNRDYPRTLFVDAQAAMKFALDAIHATMARLEPEYGADMNFVLGVVPFQQSVIDMAVVVLEHGEDPEIAALAEEMIAVQEAQMARVQAIAKAYTRVD